MRRHTRVSEVRLSDTEESFARALWSEVFLIFGIQWVLPKAVDSLLFAWRNCLGTCYSNVWNMVPSCPMGLIWREHNTCAFEDFEIPVDLLKSLLVGTLFEWSHVLGFMHCIIISDFLLLLVLLFDLFVFISSTMGSPS